MTGRSRLCVTLDKQPHHCEPQFLNLHIEAS